MQVQRAVLLLFIAIVLALAAPVAGGPSFFMGLGDLPGGSFASSALDVSCSALVGEPFVVVWGRTTVSAEAFRWTLTAGTYELTAVWSGGMPMGQTALDRIHHAMKLFAAGRGEALKRFLVEDGAGTDARFWKPA